MKSILKKLARVFHPGPLPSKPWVRLTDEGLMVERQGEGPVAIRWDEIARIITYKYDLFSTDEICIGFLTDKNVEPWVEIREEWEGFLEACKEMKRRFPTIPEDWYSEIMVPVFDRKETVLYERN